MLAERCVYNIILFVDWQARQRFRYPIRIGDILLQ
jgi:hypothetical protein